VSFLSFLQHYFMLTPSLPPALHQAEPFYACSPIHAIRYASLATLERVYCNTAELSAIQMWITGITEWNIALFWPEFVRSIRFPLINRRWHPFSGSINAFSFQTESANLLNLQFYSEFFLCFAPFSFTLRRRSRITPRSMSHHE
jgi:hypothetical protein